MSAFPAVATVIGVSKEVAESGPLLATLAVDPSMMVPPPVPPLELLEPKNKLEIKAGDPVTQAVVDNIIGKLPTKKEPVLLRCEVCNITVSSPEILQTHYSGAKHAKKLKGQELIKEITSSPNFSFVATNPADSAAASTSEFTCKICNVKVNSYQQLQQHLTGSKHKSKAESNKSNVVQVPDNSGGSQGVVSVDIGPNRLYCAACNVHVNSDLQLHQHITSNKHANKVNGKANFSSRGTPYTRRSPKGAKNWNIGGNWNGNNTEAGKWNRNSTGEENWNGTAAGRGGWRPDGSGLPPTAPRGRFPQHSAAPCKTFVPGGTLSGY